MASAPPAPPESIVLSSFQGVKNTISEERLKTGELSTAVNVDLDDAGQIRRRRGYRKLDDAVYHSAYSAGDCTFVAKNGVLGTLTPDYSFTALVEVGPEPVAYTTVADTAYFSSSVTSGKVTRGVLSPWGGIDRDVWVSPVVRPTETLGAIRGKQLGATPNATELETYKGRIYLAHEKMLWYTELFLYDLVDKTRNFIQTEDPITMLMAVSDGIYVGTTKQLLFLSGTAQEGLKMSVMRSTPVIQGSAVRVPYNKSNPQARQTTVPDGEGPMFMTGEGVCIGMDGGQVFNLTQDHVIFPGAVSAAAMFREDRGMNSYVAVTQSGGTPTTNARIGDFVDAEIIRAAERPQ